MSLRMNTDVTLLAHSSTKFSFVVFSTTQKAKMRSSVVERKKELECAIELRRKEMEELEGRKARLGEELGMDLSLVEGGNLEAAFPVVEYCGSRPKRNARQIPMEQFGSIMTQFDIAAKAIAQDNRTLEQQLHDLRRSIKLEGQRFLNMKKRSKDLADISGVTFSPSASKRDGEKGEVSNSLDDSQFTVDETPAQLGVKKAIIAKEIRAGRHLVKKKEQAVLSVASAMQERQEAVDQLNMVYNDIRVVDRDIKCEKEALRELIAEHDIVDAKLNEAIEANVSKTRLLIEQGIHEIKAEIDETVNGSRRGQERVMKAQEFRIEQLERRLECIQKSLKNNHLWRDVDSILSHRWASRGGEIVSTDVEATMYDVEAIIPPQERCHPAIYNLFLTEKERLARNISLLNIIAKEKEEVIDALACKAEGLARECQQAIQELDHVASTAAYEEELQRVESMEYIQKQRLHYSELFREMWQLKTKSQGLSWRNLPKS
ncbi:hypothetical protein TRVL_02283 [Trypanosoma vivax]|uniref:Uncharacterized protein n=1 Tax=Trypanosoma vivax (strain Y486) TaxID=1055687 RepID=G0TXF7_TRYVY|nr:hypothetical protein TRVL_02283 [Trypanosoma vivax]CCC48647.1 conserved hypothetical protein [Trypanosoma vivax Y486]